jgi:hypothetical protein
MSDLDAPAFMSRRKGVLLPLRVRRGRYCAFSSTVGPSSDPRVQSVLRGLLEQSADRVPGEAEIAGRLYQTLLYVPQTEEDIAYAETDQDGVPVDAPAAPPILPMFAPYVEDLRARCGCSDFLTPDTQVSLDAEFILPRFTTLDSGTRKQVTWDELRDYARLVISGPPGAGKTSCLRRLVLDMTPGGPFTSADTLPVFIQLRDFPVHDFSSHAIQRLISANQTELAAEFHAPLSGGRLLLAIDGLDELGTEDEQDTFLDRLISLCRELPRVRVILTTRESVSTDRLEGFAHVRLDPFNPAQVQQWAQRYLVSHNPVQSRWYEFLDLARFDREFAELIANPLLLALASSLHWKYPDELNSRAALLRKCIEVLVQDWDAARGIARWRQSDVSPRQVRRLLYRLSAELVSQERENIFTMADVEATVKSMTGFRESASVLLTACRASGLVTDSSDGKYCIAQQSFFDYFAANDMVRRTDSMAGNIHRYSREEDGKSFWRLACALTSDANGLLNGVIDYGAVGGRAEKRAAAYMIAQALGEEVSASESVIEECCHYVVAALETQLRGARPLDESFVKQAWPQGEDRSIVWAGGAVVDHSDYAAYEFRTTADLVRLIYRARTATTGSLLEEQLRQSRVSLVCQVADALSHDGWCEATPVPKDNHVYLYVVITQAAAAAVEQP